MKDEKLEELKSIMQTHLKNYDLFRCDDTVLGQALEKYAFLRFEAAKKELQEYLKKTGNTTIHFD